MLVFRRRKVLESVLFDYESYENIQHEIHCSPFTFLFTKQCRAFHPMPLKTSQRIEIFDETLKSSQWVENFYGQVPRQVFPASVSSETHETGQSKCVSLLRPNHAKFHTLELTVGELCGQISPIWQRYAARLSRKKGVGESAGIAHPSELRLFESRRNAASDYAAPYYQITPFCPIGKIRPH